MTADRIEKPFSVAEEIGESLTAEQFDFIRRHARETPDSYNPNRPSMGKDYIEAWMERRMLVAYIEHLGAAPSSKVSDEA